MQTSWVMIELTSVHSFKSSSRGVWPRALKKNWRHGKLILDQCREAPHTKPKWSLLSNSYIGLVLANLVVVSNHARNLFNLIPSTYLWVFKTDHFQIFLFLNWGRKLPYHGVGVPFVGENKKGQHLYLIFHRHLSLLGFFIFFKAPLKGLLQRREGVTLFHFMKIMYISNHIVEQKPINGFPKQLAQKF